MKFKKLFCILLATVIACVCLPFSATAEEAITADYVEDEVIFEYSPPASSSRVLRSASNFKSKLSSLGITEMTALDSYDSSIQTSSVTESSTTYVAKITGDVEETCRKLEKISGVVYAEPNYLLETCGYSTPTEITTPTNFYLTYEKWYLDTVMNIPAAWEKYQTCGEGVTIAVIDNGFNLEATDFPVNLWDDGNGNHGWNTANNSSDISPVYRSDGTTFEDSSHGSNVAGIIGMASNGSNFVGAAFGADLMLLKVASDDNNSSNEKSTITVDAVANAIVYAHRNGANIISMSLSITGTYPPAIEKAVNAAYADNIALVAAAGNSAIGSSAGLFYPAAASNVIGVMASGKSDPYTLTDFSNYDDSNGQYYDIVAPGEKIPGCGLAAGKFSLNSGTSQATPLVSACIALYMSVYPDKTVSEVYDALKNCSTKTVASNSTVSTSKTYTYKMLNAVELLDYSAIKPDVEFNYNTSATHDIKNDYIYGLDEGFADIANYVTVKDGTGTAEFIPTANGNGTGSLYNVYTISGELYESYTVIIFGDVNGDCKVDGQDAVIINCIINGFGEYDDCIKYAADVDIDNDVYDSDVAIVAGYAIGTETISQIR